MSADGFTVHRPSPLRYDCFYCLGEIDPCREWYAEATAPLGNGLRIRGHINCSERAGVIVEDGVVVGWDCSCPDGLVSTRCRDHGLGAHGCDLHRQPEECL
jgi:hypothetical protein